MVARAYLPCSCNVSTMFFLVYNVQIMCECPAVVIGSARKWAVFSPKEGLYFLDAQPWSPQVSPAPGWKNGECRRGGGKSLSSCRANLSGKVPNCKSSRLRTNNSEVRGYSLAPCLIWYTYSIFESFCWGVILNCSIFHTWGIWVRVGRSLKPHAAELKIFGTSRFGIRILFDEGFQSVEAVNSHKSWAQSTCRYLVG